jgi:hypothetical protein
VLSGAAQRADWANQDVECSLYKRNCPGPFDRLWEGMIGMLEELTLVIVFAGAGYLLAKATRRKPDTPRGSYLDEH